MKRQRKIGTMFIVLVALLVALACAKEAAAPSPQAEEPKGEIVIGILDDFSNILASLCSQQTDGRLDAIRYINEEKGGILGHPLKSMVIDHKFDASLVIAGWDRIKASGASVVISTSSGGIPIIPTAAEQDHIPVTGAAGPPEWFFPKQPSYYFVTVSWYDGIYNSLADMIQKDWAKRGQTRPPKVGFDSVSIGNFQKIYGKLGKLVATEKGWPYTLTYTSLRPADVTTQVLQVKNFGCDYLFLTTPETGIIPWLKELDRQSYRPVIFGSTTLGSAEIWQATDKLVVGATTYQYGPQWQETNYPLVKIMHELNTKWHPEVKYRVGHYIRGFSEAMTLAEALKKAIETSGFENLNGETMKTAMETIRDFDPGIGSTYTWTPTDHAAIAGCRWYRWTDEGQLVSASDWYTFAPVPEEQKTMDYWLTE